MTTRGLTILHHTETHFLGGNLYAGATYTRVYTVISTLYHLVSLVTELSTGYLISLFVQCQKI